jgi:hypothetical protein
MHLLLVKNYIAHKCAKKSACQKTKPRSAAEKNTKVGSLQTATNKPRYASAEAASALPGFLCFVQRHIACV